MTMHRHKLSPSTTDNEQGFASIVIALTLIILLALLTVGFAQLARREQQTALNKQLANQAYYAAESGVNDAVNDIHNNYICDKSIDPATCSATNTHNGKQCILPTDVDPAAATHNPVINSANGVSYTCVLASLTPDHVDFGDIPSGNDQYLNFDTTKPLDTLTITWQSADNQNTFKTGAIPTGSEFSDITSWNSGATQYPPVVMFSLVPAPDSGVSRSALINKTFNVFLYPADNHTGYPVTGNSTQVAVNTALQGQVVPGNCGKDPTAPTSCSVTLTGIGGPLFGAGGTSFIMYFTSYYDLLNIQAKGTAIDTSPVQFIGQDVIDVTGKAHNVLKRIHVTMIANKHTGQVQAAPILEGSSVEGGALCKRIAAQPNLTVSGNTFTSTYRNEDETVANSGICGLSN